MPWILLRNIYIQNWCSSSANWSTLTYNYYVDSITLSSESSKSRSQSPLNGAGCKVQKWINMVMQSSPRSENKLHSYVDSFLNKLVHQDWRRCLHQHHVIWEFDSISKDKLTSEIIVGYSVHLSEVVSASPHSYQCEEVLFYYRDFDSAPVWFGYFLI